MYPTVSPRDLLVTSAASLLLQLTHGAEKRKVALDVDLPGGPSARTRVRLTVDPSGMRTAKELLNAVAEGLRAFPERAEMRRAEGDPEMRALLRCDSPADDAGPLEKGKGSGIGVGEGPFVLEVTVRPPRPGAPVTTDCFSFPRNDLSPSIEQVIPEVVSTIMARPQMLLAEVSAVSPEQWEWLVALGRGQAVAFGDRSIAEVVERQCLRSPDAVALARGAETVTYAELNSRANQVAYLLAGCGVQPGDRVGVLLGNTQQAVIALLGVWKAGAAFVPMTNSFPAERISLILRDAGVRTAISDETHRGLLPSSVSVLEVPDGFPDEQFSGPRPISSPGDVAYVMYTSGSTGVPKGVEVLHSGIWRLIADRQKIGVGEDDVVLQLAPVAFDASMLEIWPCLAAGGRLEFLTVPRPSLNDIARTIEERRVTLLWLTAGLFHQMVQHSVSAFRSVRRLLVGGDVVSPVHVQRVLEACPGIEVVNGYGPTEATVFTCCHVITSPQDFSASSVPIGTPIANTQVFVVSDALQPVPHGSTGELCIGGTGLAKGYVNAPELTAERFITPTSGPLSGVRLYRTGDYCRWNGGLLEFVGRRDFQVKIRGYRIEIGEIEAVLTRHAAIAEVSVMAVEDRVGSKLLIAIVRLQPSAQLSTELRADLRSHCTRSLPTYMVPQRWRQVDEFPLTDAGKIDRKALEALASGRDKEDG